ncbi:flippase [Kiritimatiellota bacterium B12222]|nr:flippase [Kiritimatiellota bacterium B12222]
MNHRNSLIRSFIGIGFIRSLAILAGLVTSILLARTLSPETFGQYAFAMAFLPILTLPVAGGLPSLLTREIAGYVHNQEWSLYKGLVNSAHFFVFILSLVVFICFGLIVRIIPPEEKWTLVGIIVVLMPIQGLNSIRNGIIKGLGYPAYAEVPMQVIHPILVLTSCVILAYLYNLTSVTAIWTQVLAGSISLLFASYAYRYFRPKELKIFQPHYRIKEWAIALSPLTLIVLVNTFNTRIGIIMLGILGTDEAVAALRVGESSARFVGLPIVLVNAVISPHIVRLTKIGNTRSLQQLSRKSARGALIIALPFALILGFFGKPLILHIFGQEYVEVAYLPLLFLTFSQLFSVFCGSVGQLLSMSGNEKETLKGQIFSLGLNILTCFLLIPIYGAPGAAIGTSVGIISWNILLGISVHKKLKIRPSIF